MIRDSFLDLSPIQRFRRNRQITNFTAERQGVKSDLCKNANWGPNRRDTSIDFRCDQTYLVEVEEKIAAALTASLAGARHWFTFQPPLLAGSCLITL